LVTSIKFMIILFGISAFCFAGKNNEDYSMQVCLNASQACDSVIFDVMVVQTTAHTLIIYWRDLPWGSTGSLNLHAISNCRDQKQLKIFRPMESLNPTIDSIKSGDTLRSRINIGVLFPDMFNVLKKCDVIISWKYELQNQEKKPFGLKTGKIIVPKITGDCKK